ncbi:MAG: ferrous iron transporter B [Clostridia bacterium]|nr:ferrous iron transporter B [Clostridia bacterium]
MNIRIALAGNPNCGKTTLFNALTGSNQFVGNWPGVTVEKKEGKLKKHEGVIVTDLPGIYSLSPYTLEEVVARKYLIEERPDAILNIIDGTNLERNLYLTTQLTELGIPVVIAINMMDVVRKNGDKIDIKRLSEALGCKIVEISALKGDGVMEAAEAAIEAAKNGKTVPQHNFSGAVEHAIAHIEEAAVHGLPEEQQRWYAIKIFERDDKVLEQLSIDAEKMAHIEEDIAAAEKELDDDAESIITNERYIYIGQIIKGAYKKRDAGKMTVSDKIDRVVTNRWAALPIFAAIMFLVYFISVYTVGTWVTDWTNDGLFGDGWRFLGIGTSKYEDAVDAYAAENVWTTMPVLVTPGIEAAVDAEVPGAEEILGAIEEEDFGAFEEAWGSYGPAIVEHYGEVAGAALDEVVNGYFEGAPDPAEYGAWIPGIPVLFEKLLDAMNAADWVKSLVLDGIVGGVGAVLGFVPQILVLFILLAFLESCGYMARIAFVMDRIFRKFGLSGKSFIPMLIGTGCGVPGIMASRTIENERDRRMTIMTTTFIPCGAKMPIIALIAGALFNNGWWVAPVAYFIGVAAIIISGVMLKKTKMFAGDPAPFVMELPAYHLPTVSNILRSMWERGWSFIKKAGTIILASTIVIWFFSSIGTNEAGALVFCSDELVKSWLDYAGSAISWIFAPLGFNDSTAAVATVMGLVAKEEVVAVFGVTDFMGMGRLSAFSFLIFNLLCAPCFAAIGAIKREMNSAKWTWFAIGYQCGFAYVISLIVYNLGCLFSGNVSGALGVICVILAFAAVGALGYMLFRPYKEATKLELDVKVAK